MARNGPVFGGYVLPAVVAAFVAGIALESGHALGLAGALPWLGVAGAALALVVITTLLARRWADVPWRLGQLAPLGLVLLASLCLGGARAAASDPSLDPSNVGQWADGATVQVRGVIGAEPEPRVDYRLLTVQVSAISFNRGQSWEMATGRISVTDYAPETWYTAAYGDTIVATGALKPPGTGYVPPGITGSIERARLRVLTHGGNPVLAWLYALRVLLAESLQHALPEPEASLLVGIAFGLKTPLLRSRLPLFTTTGTIHLVVPAGLKVSVLATLAHRVAQPLGRYGGTALSLGVVAGYAFLGGGGPAAVRAAIMGALLVIGPAIGRVYDVFTALAVAVLVMVLFEPLVVYDAGFQLTTLATAGLPLLTPPLAGLLRQMMGRLRIVPASAVVAELLAVTLAAQIATLPVLVASFGLISLVAPLANLLTVPLLAPLLLLGFALSGLSLANLTWGGPLLATVTTAGSWLAWPFVAWVNTAISWCAHLPWAAVGVSGGALGLAVAYYLAIGGLIALVRRAPEGKTRQTHRHAAAWPGRRLALAGVTLALLTTLGASVPAMAAGQAPQVTFLDVGPGGQATLIRLPGGQTVLIDGGASGPMLEGALAAHLPFWQRRLDLMLLTGPRAGNIRGLEDALGHFQVTQAADAGVLHPGQDYLGWRQALARRGVAWAGVRAGARIMLDAHTSVEVLAPPPVLYGPANGTTAASNDAILLVRASGLRVLLLGNADAFALTALLGAGVDLHADVVQLARLPGESLVLDGALSEALAATHAKALVITDAATGPGSRRSRLAASLGRGLSDADVGATLGMAVLRTSDVGTLSLRIERGSWVLR